MKTELAGRRILAVARKEFLHIIYDFRTLAIAILIPVVQLLLFGYALNLEIRRVDMAVIDLAHSTNSRRLIEQFRGSRFFHLFDYDGSISDLDGLFKNRQARVALVIPADFEPRLATQVMTPVQLLIDAADANAATLIRNYCTQVLLDFNQSRGMNLPLPFDVRTAILFNPDLKSSHFFVPAIIASLLIMISALLTSITISREKETGTMEQILVSPLRPSEIILGKVLPYVAVALLDALVVLAVGLLLFRVPFRGDPLLLALLTLLYVLAGLSLGLLISTRTRTQQVAMMIAVLVTLLPTILLSGFVFPIASMPRLLRYISYVIPARYYLLIVRGIMLKGSTLAQLLTPTLALTVMTLFLLGVAIRQFRLKL
jgi:ABC-2 type transport system permease protein